MLKIQALTYNDLPPVIPVGGIIPKEGGSLGRDKGNALILPDPMKAVSRLHLHFSPALGDLYKVKNISNGNPAFVNDKELPSGKGHVLRDGDKISIGGYVLQANYSVEEKESERVPATANNNTDDSEKDDLPELMNEAKSGDAAAKNVSGPDPFAYEGKPALVDPIHALNTRGLELGTLDDAGDELIKTLQSSDDVGKLIQDPLVSDKKELKKLRDDDSLDPMAFFGGDSGSDLDNVLKMDVNVEENPLENLAAVADTPSPSARSRKKNPKPAQPSTAPAIISDDFDRFLDDINPHPAAEKIENEPQSAHKAETGNVPDGTLPPSVSVESTTAKPSRKKSSAGGKTRTASSSRNAKAFYQAFIEGLGISGLPEREGLDSDFIRLVGRLFRECIQGTVNLMTSRAFIKSEVKANITMIAPDHNNPLKFSPNSNVALVHLLGERIQGFLEPEEAVKQAFLDLLAHQIGVVSGMQSALNHVLDRFHPEIIEKENSVQGTFGGVLSLWGKARLWDAYERYFHKTRENVNDHFQSFFGTAFLEAYEKVISKQPDERNES